MPGELILLSQCILRPLVPADAPALARHGNNRNVAIHAAGLPSPLTTETCDAWIRQGLEDNRRIALAIEIGGEAAGCVVLTLRAEAEGDEADVGYWLSETYWNRGIVTEALKALMAYAFLHHRLARVRATVHEGNTASKRVLEKCGFVRDGESKVLDQVVYSLGGEAFWGTG